jgi:hypothetical protein
MTSEPARNEPIDEFLKRTMGDSPDRALQNPQIAGEIHHRLSAEPLPEGVVAPITLALPQGLAPIEYVMHVWTYKCTLCNTEHRHSEIFGVNHLRSRTGAGAFVRNMSPVSRLEWQIPLKVHNLTTRTTAGCFECLDAIREEILPSLPQPPAPVSVPRANLSGAQAPARPDRDKKRPLTTDDFMV